MANVLIASTGIVYHTMMTCPMAQKISEPHSIPQRDAELYFRRTECMKCRKQGQAQEETTVATDERTVAAFELSDLGVDHAQYFQGAGVAFTSWDEVFVGVGDTAQEAASDAIDNWGTSSGDWLPEQRKIADRMGEQAQQFDSERSAHDECEHDPRERTTPEYDVLLAKCPCHDECEMQHHVALYVRYAEPCIAGDCHNGRPCQANCDHHDCA